MKLLISIVLLMTFTRRFGQIDFEPDTNSIALYPNITNKIKNLPHDFDFQFRFWVHGGISLPDKKDLFIMTEKNGIWNCQYYKFIYKKKKQYQILETNAQIDNCDSIWHIFMKNEILNLPDMQTLKKDFYFVDQNGDTAKILVMDGLNYSLEFFKPNKYKRIEYHCPVTYGKKYSHIRELKFITNIIRLIYRKIGNDYEPC